jgi:hypothetical protein
MGHESEATTFVNYGAVPAHKQKEIMLGLGAPRLVAELGRRDMKALEDFVASLNGAKIIGATAAKTSICLSSKRAM